MAKILSDDPIRITDYAARIAWYDDKLCTQVLAFEKLSDILAELEREVRLQTLLWFKLSPDNVKVTMEKAEMLACSDNGIEQKKYLDMILFRKKSRDADVIISATKAGLSGVQSLLRFAGGGG